MDGADRRWRWREWFWGTGYVSVGRRVSVLLVTAGAAADIAGRLFGGSLLHALADVGVAASVVLLLDVLANVELRQRQSGRQERRQPRGELFSTDAPRSQPDQLGSAPDPEWASQQPVRSAALADASARGGSAETSELARKIGLG